jgi:hypothetical protein
MLVLQSQATYSLNIYMHTAISRSTSLLLAVLLITHGQSKAVVSTYPQITSNMKTHLVKHGIYCPTFTIPPGKKGPDIRTFMLTYASHSVFPFSHLHAYSNLSVDQPPLGGPLDNLRFPAAKYNQQHENPLGKAWHLLPDLHYTAREESRPASSWRSS